MKMKNTDGSTTYENFGTYENPIILDGPIPSSWPSQHALRSHLWVIPNGGPRTKWYRSYGDYCD